MIKWTTIIIIPGRCANFFYQQICYLNLDLFSKPCYFISMIFRLHILASKTIFSYSLLLLDPYILLGQIDPLAPGSGSAPVLYHVRLMFIQTRGRLQPVCLRLCPKKLFVENLGAAEARGPGARAPMAPLLIRHCQQ